jgi:hypothetical protein
MELFSESFKEAVMTALADPDVIVLGESAFRVHMLGQPYGVRARGQITCAQTHILIQNAWTLAYTSMRIRTYAPIHACMHPAQGRYQCLVTAARSSSSATSSEPKLIPSLCIMVVTFALEASFVCCFGQGEVGCLYLEGYQVRTRGGLSAGNAKATGHCRGTVRPSVERQ